MSSWKKKKPKLSPKAIREHKQNTAFAMLAERLIRQATKKPEPPTPGDQNVRTS